MDVAAYLFPVPVPLSIRVQISHPHDWRQSTINVEEAVIAFAKEKRSRAGDGMSFGDGAQFSEAVPYLRNEVLAENKSLTGRPYLKV